MSPMASDGWTTASGAMRNAAASSGQPRKLSPVPANQRGRRTSRVRSPTRAAASWGISRASSACNATPRL